MNTAKSTYWSGWSARRDTLCRILNLQGTHKYTLQSLVKQKLADRKKKESEHHHRNIQMCGRRPESSPLSPSFLNRSLPGRALEAVANILLTSCQERTRRQIPSPQNPRHCAPHEEFSHSETVNIPELLRFSF